MVIAENVEVFLGELLSNGAPEFPPSIETSSPTLLFGGQGRNTSGVPDKGIQTFGPYMYMQHTRSQPLLAVICESRHRGLVEEFVKSLIDGVPDELWQGTRGPNPFRGGLIGKFRLDRVRVEYEECAGKTEAHYREASNKLLERVDQLPDLALIQIREEHASLPTNRDPYYTTKSIFMKAGVPTQAVKIEKMRPSGIELPFLLNNVALASYAKMDGIPWVISSRGTTSHELVIGIGSAEVANGRFGTRDRYVGITTLFQGDGRYLVWGLTREVPADEYADALFESLRSTTEYVRKQIGWEQGDRIRLICHVHKRLKDREAVATKALVRQLLEDQFEVEFAFLDISSSHPYRLVAPKQPGIRYGGNMKGKGVPDRGVCLQLDRHRALLHLTGPRDVKTEEQGLPTPLLIELHPESDFTDMTYLARQVYHFSFASWQSFHVSTLPVTIKYSRMIADLLGNLNCVEGWDSASLSAGGLRNRRWFL